MAKKKTYLDHWYLLCWFHLNCYYEFLIILSTIFQLYHFFFGWRNHLRRVWRYQRGNQNLYIEEQTTQWPKEKEQTTIYKTYSTHKTKDWITWTPLKTGGELKCSRSVSSSFCTSGTRCINLVTNLVISHEWGKDQEVFMTSGTYPWSFVIQIFHNGQPCHGGNYKTFEVMTSA